MSRTFGSVSELSSERSAETAAPWSVKRSRLIPSKDVLSRSVVLCIQIHLTTRLEYLQARAIVCGSLRFIRRLPSCWVGGGALDCSRADLRPPHKLDVQFSRIQLSRRRSPLSGDGRDQRDKIDKPELAVELAAWQRCPAAAAPFAKPMRPNSPHEPAIELVEELSDVSPLVVVAPTTHDGVDLFY